MFPYWSDDEAVEILDQLYCRYLNRTPDPEGLVTYGGALTRGELSVEDVTRSILTSPEFRNRYAHRVAYLR
jgi:hypothetical protein